MKRNIALFSALCVVTCVMARPVSSSVAARYARMLLGVDASQVSSTVRSRMGVRATQNPTFYVFNSPDEQGFAIVSGDDDFPAVVGYSHVGSFPTEGEMPPALQAMLQSYDQYVQDVRAGLAQAPERRSPVENPTPVVDALITSQWGQDDPYNALTPSNSPVGCVATALAQIMRYWQWPAQGKGVAQYTYSSGYTSHSVYCDLSQDTYDWTKMVDKNNTFPAARKQAVSLISRDCGYATKMSYGSDGSGTYPNMVIEALYSNFSYRASTINIHYRDCYASQQQWIALIRQELDAKRPLFYSGYSTSGGHAFICDGYDTQDNVHINWGWDGSYNGFFDVATLSPYGARSYSESQTIIRGIIPDYEGNDTIRQQYRALLTDKYPEVRETSAQLGTEVPFNMGTIMNYTSEPRYWQVGIGLFDVDGNLLQDVSVHSDEFSTLYLTAFDYKKNYASLRVNIPTTVADGEYYLRDIFTEMGYDEWVLPDVDGGERLNRVSVRISGGVAYFNEEITAVQAPQASTSVITSWYDLMGRQTALPTRPGLYIHDGKKILVK